MSDSALRLRGMPASPPDTPCLARTRRFAVSGSFLQLDRAAGILQDVSVSAGIGDGAISSFSSALVMDSCTFDSGDGGAYQGSLSRLSTVDSSITNSLGFMFSSSAAVRGTQSALLLLRVNASGNQRGVVAATESVVQLFNSQFDSNSAPSGPAASSVRGFLHIASSTFTDNVATAGGGGAVSSVDTALRIERSVFAGNTARDSFVNGGGALFISAGSPVITALVHATFTRNTAVSWSGGAIAISEAVVHLADGVVFLNNTAVLGGGAISINSGQVFLDGNASFFDNSCPGGGGGAIYALVSHCGAHVQQGLRHR